MKVLRSIACAFAMFSRIPMPRALNLQKEDMRYMMAAFPLVGVLVGLVAFAWWWVCQTLGFSDLFVAGGLFVVPLVVAGAMHMDGFADVCDALSSHAEPARKREILADPHVGSFAIISIAIYVVLYVCVLTELTISLRVMWMLALVYVFERALSGLCALTFPKSSDEGMLASFSQEASTRTSLVVLAIIALACVAGMACINWLAALCVVIGAAAAVAYVYVTARKQFGGMSGDLSGFFLQLAELLMFVALLLAQKVVFFL